MENLNEKIFQKIKCIISDFFTDNSDSKPEVNLLSNLREELRFDELALIELTLWLENEFKLEILDDDIEEFFKIQDVIDYIQVRV